MARYPKQDDPKGKNVIPSVTEIISDCTNSSGALTQWAANMCKEWIIGECEWNTWEDDISQGYYTVRDSDLDDMRFNFRKVSQKALDIGSEVHGLIEEYLRSGKDLLLPLPKNEQVENAFDAFLTWENEHNLIPIALEQTVYGNGWAGTLDFYGYFNDKLYVIDWKSSKAHYPEMRYQVAAYRWAKTEGQNIIPEAIQGCGVLRLDKETGLPDWKDTSGTYEQDLEVFNAMVDLYFKRHPKIAKKARG